MWPACRPYSFQHFNSQPHEEADSNFLYFPEIGRISTHSLTKRLTSISFGCITGFIYFNSQPHEEADSKLQMLTQVILIFQLTASRRG